eukprot:Skav216259  [mRNA]  locus=scaffold20:730317:733576:+ [translate_table: standard]
MDVVGLAKDWDDDESIRELLRRDRKLCLHPLSEKWCEPNRPNAIRNSAVLIPALKRLALHPQWKLPYLEPLQVEVDALFEKNSTAANAKQCYTHAVEVKRLLGFVKRRAKRREVLTRRDQLNAKNKRKAKKDEGEAEEDEEGEGGDDDDGGDGPLKKPAARAAGKAKAKAKARGKAKAKAKAKAKSSPKLKRATPKRRGRKAAAKEDPKPEPEGTSDGNGKDDECKRDLGPELEAAAEKPSLPEGSDAKVPGKDPKRAKTKADPEGEKLDPAPQPKRRRSKKGPEPGTASADAMRDDTMVGIITQIFKDVASLPFDDAKSYFNEKKTGMKNHYCYLNAYWTKASAAVRLKTVVGQPDAASFSFKGGTWNARMCCSFMGAYLMVAKFSH